jgi:hypothetical protein
MKMTNSSDKRKSRFCRVTPPFEFTKLPELPLRSSSFAQCPLFSAVYIFAEEMAEDTREGSQNGASIASIGTGGPPKKLPRGMVLGKDGKP